MLRSAPQSHIKPSPIIYHDEETSNDSKKNHSEGYSDYLIEYDEDYYNDTSPPLSLSHYPSVHEVKQEPFEPLPGTSNGYQVYPKVKKKRRNRRKKWNEAKELQLCQIWKRERNLYDSNHPDHRQSDKRQESMKRVAAELGISEKDVLLRMQTLRTAFTKLSNQQMGSLTNPTHRQLFILKTCRFLVPYVKSLKDAKDLPLFDLDETAKKRRITMEAAAESLGENLVLESIAKEDRNSRRNTKTTSEEGDSYSVIESNSGEKLATGEAGWWEEEEEEEGEEGGDEEDRDRALLKERNDLFASMAASVAKIAKSMTESPPPPPSPNPHQVWGQLLASKVEAMEPRVRERFKLTVDKLACDALDGLWSPPNTS